MRIITLVAQSLVYSDNFVEDFWHFGEQCVQAYQWSEAKFVSVLVYITDNPPNQATLCHDQARLGWCLWISLQEWDFTWLVPYVDVWSRPSYKTLNHYWISHYSKLTTSTNTYQFKWMAGLQNSWDSKSNFIYRSTRLFSDTSVRSRVDHALSPHSK